MLDSHEEKDGKGGEWKEAGDGREEGRKVHNSYRQTQCPPMEREVIPSLTPQNK